MRNEITTTTDMRAANGEALENTAAIASEFRQDSRYWDFYERYREQLSGFCGIWTFLGFAGARFTLLWPSNEEFEWVESIQTVVNAIYRAALEGAYQTDVQSADWLDQVVYSAIAEMKNPKRGTNTEAPEDSAYRIAEVVSTEAGMLLSEIAVAGQIQAPRLPPGHG